MIHGTGSHRHDQMNEVYLVARGHSLAEVDGKRIRLQAGDMLGVLVVEPGERHTFIESSHDYPHFVVQAPSTRERAHALTRS